MINLKETSLQFRIDLSRKSEPFFLCYKKQRAFINTRRCIGRLFTSKENKMFDKEIWTLISATSQTIRYDSDSCQIPLDWTKYAAANKITDKKISCTRMRKLILMLESKDLVVMYKGYHSSFSNKKGVEKSMRSTIVFTTEWLRFFKVSLCATHGTARIFDLVILKDCDGNIISHKGMRGVGVEKTLLKNWNTKLSETKITIGGVLVKPLYTTIFNNATLEEGGRLYAGYFSNERSYLRKTITLNDLSCSEVDYKNIHFRILYNEKGIDYNEDAYGIDNLHKWCPIELRKACKKAGVIMLNADSELSAQSALIKELGKKEHFTKEGKSCEKKDKDYSYSVSLFKTIPNNKKSSKYILKKLQEKHPLISLHFFKAEWGRLQHLDSLIAKQVVKAFLSVGEPVLTYHDSFVCAIGLQGFLIEKMKEAWEIVLGSSLGFGYDIEF